MGINYNVFSKRTMPCKLDAIKGVGSGDIMAEGDCLGGTLTPSSIEFWDSGRMRLPTRREYGREFGMRDGVFV